MPSRKRPKKEAPPAPPPSSIQEPEGAAPSSVGNENRNEFAPAAADDSASHAHTPDRADQSEDGGRPPESSDDPEDAAGEPSGKGVHHGRSGAGFAAAGGYNALKSFHGQYYSGMAVGGSHTWNYDQGVWKETKVEPDLWQVKFETTKRRARNAPKESGAPVGAEYHWLIVAHQHVKKVDANTYETRLEGSKYKLAHKLASSQSWSVPTVKAQREREVELLEDAKRRVQGLPPVSAGEKVKVTKDEKGQQKLDALFAKAKGKKELEADDRKRKRGVSEGRDDLDE